MQLHIDRHEHMFASVLLQDQRRTALPTGRSAALGVPGAGPQVSEDDGVAAVLEDELEVAALEGFGGPPAVLDDPVLANGLDVKAANRDRPTVETDLDARR